MNTVAIDSLYQITEDDIQKAFKAQPQLIIPLNLAIYNAGYETSSFNDSLINQKYIRQIYPISSALIEGNRYYERKLHPWYSSRNPPPLININQIRLLAAQGKADVLIYYGISFKEEVIPNALVWTHILIIPGIFMPSFHINVVAEVDLYFIDVRNNFLYSYQKLTDEFNKRWVTYWYTENLEPIRKILVNQLVSKMIITTKDILTNPKFLILKE